MDQKKIKHYGLNLIEPNQRYSVAEFQSYAKNAINDIRKRKKIPILVGGSGLYVDSILFDYSFQGTHDPIKRSTLNNMDIENLAKIAKGLNISVTKDMLQNKRHLVGAIERGSVNELVRKRPNNTLIIGLRISRSSIRNNINDRVETMFKSGLRKEIDDLVNEYGWECEALSGIGYSEFKDWYMGTKSMSQVKKSIVQNTLKYAKRQKTWFKRNQFIEWFESQDEAFERVEGYLGNRKRETENGKQEARNW